MRGAVRVWAAVAAAPKMHRVGNDTPATIPGRKHRCRPENYFLPQIGRALGKRV